MIGHMTENRWPIAKEGFPFLIPMALVSIFAGVMGSWIGLSFGALLTLFVAYFFRNPRRQIPNQRGAILSPADGTVIHV